MYIHTKNLLGLSPGTVYNFFRKNYYLQNQVVTVNMSEVKKNLNIICRAEIDQIVQIIRLEYKLKIFS